MPLMTNPNAEFALAAAQDDYTRAQSAFANAAEALDLATDTLNFAKAQFAGTPAAAAIYAVASVPSQPVSAIVQLEASTATADEAAGLGASVGTNALVSDASASASVPATVNATEAQVNATGNELPAPLAPVVVSGP